MIHLFVATRKPLISFNRIILLFYISLLPQQNWYINLDWMPVTLYFLMSEGQAKKYCIVYLLALAVHFLFYNKRNEKIIQIIQWNVKNINDWMNSTYGVMLCKMLVFDQSFQTLHTRLSIIQGPPRNNLFA